MFVCNWGCSGELSLVVIEGFVVVKLLVEGLCCVGKDLMWEGLLKVFDGLC